MEVLYKSCCGLDVHKKLIVACIVNAGKRETKSFGTMTEDLLELVEWIKACNCEAVAMEITGVFWKPIYNLLELENITTLVVNANHIKAVPGRNTDVKDSEWFADLLKHGLLRGSFIPSREQRELRELVRYRRSMVNERSREISRIQKILQGANIKLNSVATNIMGVSGRSMLEKIITEIGTNMDQFPSEGHISAWAGLCLANNESAGKRKSASARERNKYLRSTLIECAHNSSLHKSSYFYSQYHRIAARRGANKAAVAVTHSMLIVIYNMIKNKQHYYEIGFDYFDKKDSEHRAQKLAKKIEALGYSVTIQKAS